MAKFKISINEVEHGALATLNAGLDQQYCEAGDTVHLQWQPDAEWGLQEAHYSHGGTDYNIDITAEDPSFVMPSADVTIGGTFKRFVTQHWTDGKKDDLNTTETMVYKQGGNGEPVAITLDQLVALLVDTRLDANSGRPVANSAIVEALAGIEGMTFERLGFEAFNENKEYIAGNIVVKDNVLYVFDTTHTAGTAWDADEVTASTLLQLIAEGKVSVMATDITPKSSEAVEVTNLFTIQTTGGDLDLKSGASLLLDIKGYLDDNLNPFFATSLVSTGDNLVDPSQYVTIVGKRAYIFPVATGVWGSYGTTQENNGYVINGGDVDSVYYSVTKPTSTSFGELCDTHVENGRTYYLPSGDGWLVIVCNDTEDVPACHVAWSNYKDNVAGTFGNTVKDIAADIAWIHPWGMARLTGGGRTVFDEIDYANGMRYRRDDMVLLPNLTWTMETVTDGDTTTHVFTANVSGMAANGLWRSSYADMEVSGTTVTIRSTTISSVEDLETALDGEMIFYELASVVSSATSTTTANTANDFGLTYLMNGDELVTVPAYITEAFYQSGKDQLFNAVTYQKILAEVLAAAVCQLDGRVKAIEDSIANGFGYLKVVNLEVTRNLNEPA